MSTPELTIRLTAMVLGVLAACVGAVLAYLANQQGREDGCLPYVLVIGGLMFAGAAYPVEWGRPW